jgi:quercetin dioxygenase-like cupin family protein
MEIKRNEATLNRPEGDRVIDAPYVYADIDDFVDQVKDEKAWKKSDRNGITIFKTEGITIVITALKDGAVIKDNTVNGIFTVQVIEGKVRMDTPEGDIVMKKRQLISFHPGVPHSIEAKKDSVLLLTSYGVENPDDQGSFGEFVF